MTRELQKKRERGFATDSARILGKAWVLSADRENPDFVVCEGDERFGLEVSEIFTGPTRRSGSTTKEAESASQRVITALQQNYEAKESLALVVNFVGTLTPETTHTLVDSLLSSELPTKSVGDHFVLDEGKGLRVHVTRSIHPQWIYIEDRVGWVDRNPIPQIVRTVESKARHLARYQQNAGSDVRLLIVADRINNSGKLTLEREASLCLAGFRRVYFFSHPEAVWVFDADFVNATLFTGI